jgi:hypothetical protein
MLCDAVREDEIFEAYLLYASLHGMSTDAQQARERIASYLDNVPDSILDEAILAFAEDRIVAPPDVVVAGWGKSRVYTMYQTPQQQWRHRVCPTWFDNGCVFLGNSRDPDLCHFWTEFRLTRQWSVLSQELSLGTRLRLVVDGKQVRVVHRNVGEVGELPPALAHEFSQIESNQVQTLSLIDRVDCEHEVSVCKLLVTRASGNISSAQIINYTSNAFQAERAKC